MEGGVTSASEVAICVCLGLGNPGAGTSGWGTGDMLVGDVGDSLVMGVDGASALGVDDVSVGGVGDVSVEGLAIVGKVRRLLCTGDLLASPVQERAEKPSQQVLSPSPVQTIKKAI